MYYFLWFHFLVEDDIPKTMLGRVELLGIVLDKIFFVLCIWVGLGEEDRALEE